LLTLFSGTRVFAGSFLETVLVLFFLLLSGDTFLRRLVEVLPRFRNKRQAIEISQHIEHDISAYLITITITVGLATALAMWLCGLGDPILWGAVAFLLNYVPILGPMIGLVTFTLAGLLTVNTLWGALLPAALYLVIHLVEGETITPMLLARRFTLNPVLVILALIFWYWMWARSWPCRCSRSRRSFATGSGCWQTSATFLRDSCRCQRPWRREAINPGVRQGQCHKTLLRAQLK
jgi:predicted PurR-regulated permease PerM